MMKRVLVLTASLWFSATGLATASEFGCFQPNNLKLTQHVNGKKVVSILKIDTYQSEAEAMRASAPLVQKGQPFFGRKIIILAKCGGGFVAQFRKSK